MVKFRLYYDKDVETDWLNKMCGKGWAFKNFFLGFYTFEKCEPGEYNYEIDLLDNPTDKDEYEAFMEDANVKVVSQWWKWVYLRKNASEGPFELYTDAESKLSHYSKIKNFFQVAFIIELFCIFTQLSVIFETRSYLQGIFIGLLSLIALALFRMILKCKKKIEQYKYGDNI